MDRGRQNGSPFWDQWFVGKRRIEEKSDAIWNVPQTSLFQDVNSERGTCFSWVRKTFKEKGFLLPSWFGAQKLLINLSSWHQHGRHPHQSKVTSQTDIALDSQGCGNKIPQTGWLKTIEIGCLTVMESRSLKQRYLQGHAPSETCRS